jgi:hypothetical protein
MHENETLMPFMDRRKELISRWRTTWNENRHIGMNLELWRYYRECSILSDIHISSRP